MELSYAFFFILSGITFSLLLFLLVKYFHSLKVGDYCERYVLITGCDSGFGKMAAEQLDNMGFHVFASCLTDKGQAFLKAHCSERLVTLPLDVTDSTQIEEAYNIVCKHLPNGVGLWALLNNAAVTTTGPIEWVPMETCRWVLDVNLYGMMDVTKTFLPLVKTSGGRIVNMSSAGGYISVPSIGVYCISKFAVEAFSSALRLELEPWGVKVIVVEPGGYRTEMTHKHNLIQALEQNWKSAPGRVRADYGEGGFQKAKNGFMDWSESCSKETHQVVDACIQAVTSQRPRPFYKTCTEAWLLYFMTVLPVCLQDFAIRALFSGFIPRPDSV